MSEVDLVSVYKSMIRPLAENAVPSWHSSIIQKKAEKLEAQQVLALKTFSVMKLAPKNWEKAALIIGNTIKLVFKFCKKLFR